MKKILFALLCAGVALSVLAQQRHSGSRIPAPARADGVSVVNAASSVGVVSPGCGIILSGGQFAVESNQALHWPLPTTLGGVTVEIGGIEAALYFVSPTEIRAIVPDVPRKIGLPVRDVLEGESDAVSIRDAFIAAAAIEGLSAAQKSLIRWYTVRVTAPGGVFTGWAAVAPTSPGFYWQNDPGGTLVVQGEYMAGGQMPRVITSEPVPNSSTVLLLKGTGFRRARSVLVFISDEADGYWTVPAAFGKFGLFDWIDQVNFQLPSEAHGRLTMTAQADAMTGNPVTLGVQ